MTFLPGQGDGQMTGDISEACKDTGPTGSDDPGGSWVRVPKAYANSKEAMAPRVVGQIFFATNSARLDFQDMEVLDNLVLAYEYALRRTQYPFTFVFHGFADARSTTTWKDNWELSMKRAMAVDCFLTVGYSLPRLRLNMDTYVGLPFPMGEIALPKGWVDAQKDLGGFRRVDIYALPVPEDPPKPKEITPKTCKRATHWRARRLKNHEVSFSFVGATIFLLEIEDLDNKRTLKFEFRGTGAGKGDPISASEESKWFEFETKEMCGEYFEGFANYNYASAGAKIGFDGVGLKLGEGKYEVMILLGPVHQDHGNNQLAILRWPSLDGPGATTGWKSGKGPDASGFAMIGTLTLPSDKNLLLKK